MTECLSSRSTNLKGKGQTSLLREAKTTKRLLLLSKGWDKGGVRHPHKSQTCRMASKQLSISFRTAWEEVKFRSIKELQVLVRMFMIAKTRVWLTQKHLLMLLRSNKSIKRTNLSYHMLHQEIILAKSTQLTPVVGPKTLDPFTFTIIAVAFKDQRKVWC